MLYTSAWNQLSSCGVIADRVNILQDSCQGVDHRLPLSAFTRHMCKCKQAKHAYICYQRVSSALTGSGGESEPKMVWGAG